MTGLPKADRPQQLGLSSDRLERLSATFRDDVDRGLIPGAVLLIARSGQIGYAEAFGWRDREKQSPMGFDAIFRIASMTKPVTSVAAMMLAEEGKLQIAAPVADYLPELKDRTIGVERVRAKRTMTVQDLLRHTSGLTYAQFGDKPVQMNWRDANLMSADQTNEELVAKLAHLPLMFEPGTTWEYSMSTDVLGRVVEVVSGQRLADFFAQRIARPLRMADTAFEATGERAARVAEPQIDPATGVRPPMHDLGRPHRWASGGGGLASSATDYLRFCQMLLNGGAECGFWRRARSATWQPTICPRASTTARRRASASVRSLRCPRWAMALVWALPCASPPAGARCRVRLANISGAACMARRSGSTRRRS